MTTAQDGGKVSLTHRPRLPPGSTPGTHFNRNQYQEYLLGDKGGRCVGLTTLLP